MKYTAYALAAVMLFFCFVGCGTQTEVTEGGISKLEDGNLIVTEGTNEINISVSAFDTFNPIMTKSPSVAEFMKTVCEPLFEYDEAYNPISVLAENYALSSDGLTASFDVRGVQFHDSTALSAADVVYTINMIKNNDTLYSDSVKYIREVFSDENGRVYIRLSEPVVNFAGMLNFPIVKNKTAAAADASYIPIGTGACKYYGRRNANQIIFAANEQWHGGTPGFKNIIVHMLKDAAATMSSFDAGETDVAASTFSDGAEPAPRGEYTTREYTSNAMTFLGINNTADKLSGKNTRKALGLLCDKEGLVQVEMYSKAEPAAFPINPSAWFYPDAAEEKSDYESVESILLRDGWKKAEDGHFYNAAGRTLSVKILVNRDNDEKMRIAESIADSFNSFGIAATLKMMDFEGYREAVREKNYELFVGEVIINSAMDPSFLTEPGDNYFGCDGTRLAEILSDMSKTADSSVIKERAAEYGAVFSEEMPFVPLFFKKERVVYQSRLSGVGAPGIYGIYREIGKWYVSKTK